MHALRRRVSGHALWSKAPLLSIADRPSRHYSANGSEHPSDLVNCPDSLFRLSNNPEGKLPTSKPILNDPWGYTLTLSGYTIPVVQNEAEYDLGGHGLQAHCFAEVAGKASLLRHHAPSLKMSCLGEYHMAYQAWAGKLAQANEGLKAGLQSSMPTPTLVPDTRDDGA